MIECEQCELWFYTDYIGVLSVSEHWSATVQLLQIQEVHPVVLQFVQKQ